MTRLTPLRKSTLGIPHVDHGANLPAFFGNRRATKSKASVAHKPPQSLPQLSIPHGVDPEAPCWSAECSLFSEMIRLMSPPRVVGCDVYRLANIEVRSHASCRKTPLPTGVHTDDWRQNQIRLPTPHVVSPVSLFPAQSSPVSSSSSPGDALGSGPRGGEREWDQESAFTKSESMRQTLHPNRQPGAWTSEAVETSLWLDELDALLRF